ncbi:MAG: hypothetical protein FIA99_03155 [Ruminiclostridium sp.]|nr:hypothetical protein [Ruminiclostridium sp.]
MTRQVFIRAFTFLNKMDEDEKNLRFLALQNGRIDSHADKIWEEMKHFSWALYILLGAPFILKNWETLDKVPYGKILIIFPVLAIIVAIIAALSICKESNDFLDALGTILSIEKRLGLHNISTDPNVKPKMLVSRHRAEMLNIDGTTDELIDNFIKTKKSIFCKLLSISNRNLFVFYFIALFIIGVVETVYIILYWI